MLRVVSLVCQLAGVVGAAAVATSAAMLLWRLARSGGHGQRRKPPVEVYGGLTAVVATLVGLIGLQMGAIVYQAFGVDLLASVADDQLSAVLVATAIQRFVGLYALWLLVSVLRKVFAPPQYPLA